MSYTPVKFHFHCVDRNGKYEVGMYCRVLMEKDDGEFWLYGVSPGAIADAGPSPEKVVENIKHRIRLVLEDIWNDSIDFEEFKDTVEKFFHQVDQESLDDWEACGGDCSDIYKVQVKERHVS